MNLNGVFTGGSTSAGWWDGLILASSIWPWWISCGAVDGSYQNSPRLRVLRSMMHRLLLRLLFLPPHPHNSLCLCGGTETPRGVALFRQGGGVGGLKCESKKGRPPLFSSEYKLSCQIHTPTFCQGQFSLVWAFGVIISLKDLFFTPLRCSYSLQVIWCVFGHIKKSEMWPRWQI